MHIHRRDGRGWYESGRWRLTTVLQDSRGRLVHTSLVDMGGYCHWVEDRDDSVPNIEYSWSPPEQPMKAAAEAAFKAYCGSVRAG